MALPLHRISKMTAEDDPVEHAADRARLLERIAAGLAHEGKNPLHNMVLHLQLLGEKLAAAGPDRRGLTIDRHLTALRDGIGKVDTLLRVFGEFAVPQHLPPDLGAAAGRALQLLQYDARRAAVQVTSAGPPALLVRSDSELLGDLVAHCLAAAIDLAHDGGTVDVHLEGRPSGAVLEIAAAGGIGRRDSASLHLAAARRLAAQASCDLSIETPPAGGGRLSLSFANPR